MELYFTNPINFSMMGIATIFIFVAALGAYRSYRKFLKGELSEFVKWTIVGTLLVGIHNTLHLLFEWFHISTSFAINGMNFGTLYFVLLLATIAFAKAFTELAKLARVVGFKD